MDRKVKDVTHCTRHMMCSIFLKLMGSRCVCVCVCGRGWEQCFSLKQMVTGECIWNEV